jgi:hypothetical protein
MRCAWPADRKGNHKTMDCYRPAKVDADTANFAKAKEYQKLWVGAYKLEDDQKDLYTEGCDSDELRDTASERSVESEELSESEDSEESSQKIANWWSDLLLE